MKKNLSDDCLFNRTFNDDKTLLPECGPGPARPLQKMFSDKWFQICFINDKNPTIISSYIQYFLTIHKIRWNKDILMLCVSVLSDITFSIPKALSNTRYLINEQQTLFFFEKILTYTFLFHPAHLFIFEKFSCQHFFLQHFQ